MSIHINAKQGEIAETVLLPGDPLRAKFIADTFLDNAKQYNDVRGMLGFTGTYKGKRISVQGTGMGVPSISIYVNELMSEYGVQRLMRIGSCGSIRPDIQLRDVVLGQAASTDSAINTLRFGGMSYAPIADFALLHQAYTYAHAQGKAVKVGNILSSDTFYNDEDISDPYKKWRDFGVMVVEMEAAALYTLAAKYQRQALALLTVSDHLITNEHCTAQERQESFRDMMEIALEIS